MVKQIITEFMNGKQMEEAKHNKLSSHPFTLTAGNRQQRYPRSSATPKSFAYYPEFDGSVQYKTSRAFILPTNPAVYFIHDLEAYFTLVKLRTSNKDFCNIIEMKKIKN